MTMWDLFLEYKDGSSYDKQRDILHEQKKG